jgi:hypothetical protein
MMPHDTYRTYQIERAKSFGEVRRADEQAARFAAAVSSLFGGIMRPVRAAGAAHGRFARPAPPGPTSWPGWQQSQSAQRDAVAGLT